MYELPMLARSLARQENSKCCPGGARTHAVLPSLLPSCPSLAWAKKLR